MAIAIKPTAAVEGRQAEELQKVLKSNPRKQKDVLSFEVNQKEISERLKSLS